MGLGLLEVATFTLKVFLEMLNDTLLLLAGLQVQLSCVLMQVTAAQLVPATPLPLVNRDLFRNLKTGCEIPVKVDPKAEKRALGGLRTLGGLSRFMIGAAALMCFRGLAVSGSTLHVQKMLMATCVSA